jgi:phage/plasmid-associated DNA primase
MIESFEVNIPEQNRQHSNNEKQKYENNCDITFWQQICIKIVREGKLLFKEKSDDKVCHAYVLKEGKYHPVSKQEVGMFCKQVLRRFLNPDVLKDIRTPYDEVIESSIKVGDIYIPRKLLKDAWNDNFSLSKEKRLLMDELYDTSELYRPDEFFLTPKNIIPFKNGYYNFDDGLLYAYDRKTYNGFLYQLNANYITENIDLKLPESFRQLIWNGISNPAFTREINIQRYEAMIDYLAYAFVPTNPMRKMFFIIGPTASGKSTLVSIMRKIFGDLGIHLQSYSIMKQSRYDHELRPDLKAAMDMLWLDLSEMNEKQVIDAVTVKSWTGNDPLTFRKPHSELRVTKVMNCKIFMVTNEFPKLVNYDDGALQDRMIIIDWHNTIERSSRNDNLEADLTTDENRDKIATFFTQRGGKLYTEKNLPIHPTFEFNILRYFKEQGDEIASFYDSLQKDIFNSPENLLNCISVYDLYLMFEMYRKEVLGIKILLSETGKRAFAMRFAEISKGDHFHFVEQRSFSNARFYKGIYVPFEQRKWLFKVPQNYNFWLPHKAPEMPALPLMPPMLPNLM